MRLDEVGGLGGMDKGRQGLGTSPPALGFHAALGGYSPFAQRGH